jgi:hypothetical protein
MEQVDDNMNCLSIPLSGVFDWVPYADRFLPVWRYEVTGHDFDYCIRLAKKLDSRNWNENKYRGGLLNGKANALFNTEEVGTLSEWAVAKMLGLVFNGNRVVGGFPYDFKINGMTYDVKGSAAYRGMNYIKAVNEDGHKCKLRSDFFILTYINLEKTNRQNKIATVDLAGVIKKEHVENLPIVPSPTTSNHANYEVLYEDPNMVLANQFYHGVMKKKPQGLWIQEVGSEKIMLR